MILGSLTHLIIWAYSSDEDGWYSDSSGGTWVEVDHSDSEDEDNDEDGEGKDGGDAGNSLK